ncbi:MAG: molybdopterin molybdotransferase [Deferribacteres bacterium]|nr:molybdopterin molybdotransferase [Deferribacteres bacterium]
MTDKHIDLYEALDIIKNIKIPIDYEFVPIENSCNLVSAQNVLASFDFPQHNRSKMDGFVFDSETTNMSEKLKIIGFLGANDILDIHLSKNECIKCSTGSNLVNNQNTVVPVEYCSEKNGYIYIENVFKPKKGYIETSGSIFKKGEILISKGNLIDHRDIERLVLNRINTIKVNKKPLIGVISTGSEITEQYVIKESIINSNFYMLHSFLKTKQVPFSYLGVIKDNHSEIKVAIEHAVNNYDIIITFGGTALGQKDLIKNIIYEIDGKIIIENINVSPGKTFKLAMVKQKPIFILPGNPASASVCIELFLNIFLDTAYYGQSQQLFNAKSYIKLNKKKGFYKFIPGYIELKDNEIIFYDRLSGIKGKQFINAIGIIDKEIETLTTGNYIKTFII